MEFDSFIILFRIESEEAVDPPLVELPVAPEDDEELWGTLAMRLPTTEDVERRDETLLATALNAAAEHELK